jgi:hypothetical protein
MKNKSLLNKIEALTPKGPHQIDIERKLLPRLKLVGYIMYTFCLVSLTYAIVGPGMPELELAANNYNLTQLAGLPLEEELPELPHNEVLNYYLISSVFAVMGTGCFIIAWKKRKKLFRNEE